MCLYLRLAGASVSELPLFLADVLLLFSAGAL